MPTDAAPRKRWSLLGRVWAGFGAAVGVIGAVTGVIGILPILTATESGADSLTLTATPYPASVSEWALPLDADRSTYPNDPDPACTAERQEWLAARAQPIRRTVLFDLRNTATSGPMVGVTDVRIDGERFPHRSEAILVVCDSEPKPPVPMAAARLDASSTGGVAVFSAENYGIQQAGLPDMPVTWNLAPGETGLVVLRIGSSVAYEGTLTASVVESGRSAPVTISVGEAERLSAPALRAEGEVYLRAGSELVCVDERVAPGEDSGCP
ncbi:hypothetical protein [Microbacterium radiodurans]|uniref:Uncharacterized protein n=1 Tax=Microbacterium radiodurans TaxID=661398 RepID=A0A5J5IS53_9MICO|nr:hypothetical protein [Microbacterium radiodurans]KAA9083796.1 hypothetical protein F6B42_14735 [Microbacterium radiodurans]